MKKKLSVSWLFIIGIAFASIMGSITVLAMSNLSIPNVIDFGATVVGQTVERPIITVQNISTGAYMNFTVTNVTGQAVFVLKAPDGVTYEVVSDVFTTIPLGGVGNWTLKITPQRIGQIYALFKFDVVNETLFNVTRI